MNECVVCQWDPFLNGYPEPEKELNEDGRCSACAGRLVSLEALRELES